MLATSCLTRASGHLRSDYMPKEVKVRTQIPVSLAAIATVVIAFFIIYFYTQRQQPTASGPPGAILLEVTDPAMLNQNGQSLVNDESTPSADPLQNTQPLEQSPKSSNLQGSPSIQEAAPADTIPDEWLE